MQEKQKCIQYNYKDSEYDENINLFNFYETKLLNNTLGLLLFDNDWGMLQRKSIADDKPVNVDSEYILMFGGGTNSITIHFNVYNNIEVDNINKYYNLEFYNKKYNGNWYLKELPLEGILARSGFEKYFIGFGIGPDIFDSIDCGTFNAYAYDVQTKRLFVISYFINFSKINLNYETRNRIYNFILFNLLFLYID